MSYADPYTPSKGVIIGGIAIVFAVIAFIFFMVAGTYESVPPDKIALHYTGGPIQGTHFVGVIQPGTGAKFYGLLENIYMLPATQRNYIVSKTVGQGDEQGADEIDAPSKDHVQFSFEAAVYFKLNTSPKVLRRFFESICLHDACYKESGWNAMLQQFFRPQLNQAVAQEAKKYLKADLYSNPDTLTALNRAVSLNLRDDINSNLGGQFFCGPDSTPGHCTNFQVVIKNPTPPTAVIEAYTATAAAQQAKAVAQNQGDADIAKAQKEAQAKADAAQGDANAQRIRASAPDPTPGAIAYIQAQALAACAANANCTLVVAPSGTNIQVGAK